MGILKLKAGDDLNIKFTITNSDDAAVNLTGGTIAFKIAARLGIANNNAQYFAEYTSFTDPTNGIHIETIPDSVTKDWTDGDYVYQVRFIDSSNIVRSEDVDIAEIEQNLIDDE